VIRKEKGGDRKANEFFYRDFPELSSKSKSSD